MKKLIFAVIAILFAGSVSGQISLSPSLFYSLPWEKIDAPLKDKVGRGLSLSCDLNKNIGIGFQMRNREWWSLNGQVDRIIPLRTISCQFYVYENIEIGTRWFFRPEAGILAGIGTPIATSDQNSGRMRQSLELLEHPYFFGICLGGGAGFKLSKNFSLLASFKIEGLVGIMTDREVLSENGSAAGNGIFRIGGLYSFSKD